MSEMSVSLLTARLSELDPHLRPFARNEPALMAALRAEGVPSEWVEWGGSEEQLSEARRFPVTLIRSTWNYSDSLAKKNEFLAWLKQLVDGGHTTLLNGLETVEWNSDKRYLLELEGAGVPIVPTKIVEPGDPPPDICSLASMWNTHNVIVKPVVGASARGLSRHEFADEHNLEGILVDIARLVESDGGALLQPFIPEILEGETSIVCIDRKPVAAALKVPRRGEFRVQEEHGGKVIATTLTECMIDAATKVLRVLPGECLLYARLDFVKVMNSDGGMEYLLMEAECIEPELFFNLFPDVASLVAKRVATIFNSH